MAVDYEKLRELFTSGMRIADIASQFGVTLETCQTYISRERKKDPFAWPKRKATQKDSDNAIKVYMHLYECTDCFCNFAVEDYEGIDQSVIECPHCHNDELIEDAGYGYFVKTKEADKNTN